jgi:hypothetical protein
MSELDSKLVDPKSRVPLQKNATENIGKKLRSSKTIDRGKNERESRLLEIIRHYINVYGIDPELHRKLSIAAPELLPEQPAMPEEVDTDPKVPDFVSSPPPALLDQSICPAAGHVNSGNDANDDLVQSAATLAQMPFFPSATSEALSDDQYSAIIRESQENGFLPWDTDLFSDILPPEHCLDTRACRDWPK